MWHPLCALQHTHSSIRCQSPHSCKSAGYSAPHRPCSVRTSAHYSHNHSRVVQQPSCFQLTQPYSPFHLRLSPVHNYFCYKHHYAPSLHPPAYLSPNQQLLPATRVQPRNSMHLQVQSTTHVHRLAATHVQSASNEHLQHRRTTHLSHPTAQR